MPDNLQDRTDAVRCQFPEMRMCFGSYSASGIPRGTFVDLKRYYIAVSGDRRKEK